MSSKTAKKKTGPENGSSQKDDLFWMVKSMQNLEFTQKKQRDAIWDAMVIEIDSGISLFLLASETGLIISDMGFTAKKISREVMWMIHGLKTEEANGDGTEDLSAGEAILRGILSSNITLNRRNALIVRVPKQPEHVLSGCIYLFNKIKEIRNFDNLYSGNA